MCRTRFSEALRGTRTAHTATRECAKRDLSSPRYHQPGGFSAERGSGGGCESSNKGLEAARGEARDAHVQGKPQDGIQRGTINWSQDKPWRR